MGALDVPAGGPDAESALVTRDAIDRALSALPDTLREAVVLRDVEGLDYKEIAVVIDAPIGNGSIGLGLDRDELPAQLDADAWPALKRKVAAIFKTKTRDEWCEIMEGSDVCFAPVLTFNEAPDHPHNKARGTFVDVEGVAQPNPAPRFSRTPGSVKGAAPDVGADTREGLLSWGFDAGEVDALMEDKAIGWQG